MASILTGLFKRVIKVRVQGAIDQKLTDSISLGFQKGKNYIPEAVIVVINSPGGSLSQAKHISDILKNYSARKNTPIYCFAEDQCLGSANVILTSGVKAYANQMSMIGDFNYSWGRLWFKKFADKYNMRVEYVYSGQNKVKFNPFEQIKPQSQKWMQNYLYLLQHDLKCTIIDQRQRSLTKIQMDKKQIEQKIFKNTLIPPQQAIKLGLIDGIMNVDQLVKTTFHGVKVYEVNKKQKLQKVKRLLDSFELLK